MTASTYHKPLSNVLQKNCQFLFANHINNTEIFIPWLITSHSVWLSSWPWSVTMTMMMRGMKMMITSWGMQPVSLVSMGTDRWEMDLWSLSTTWGPHVRKGVPHRFLWVRSCWVIHRIHWTMWPWHLAWPCPRFIYLYLWDMKPVGLGTIFITCWGLRWGMTSSGEIQCVHLLVLFSSSTQVSFHFRVVGDLGSFVHLTFGLS